MCFARLPTHLIPDCQDVGVAHTGGCHACGRINCSIVPLNKFGQDINIFIRVLIGEISVQFIAQRPVDTLHDCTFDVWISTDLKLDPRVLATFEIGYSKTISPYLYAPTRAVCV